MRKISIIILTVVALFFSISSLIYYFFILKPIPNNIQALTTENSTTKNNMFFIGTNKGLFKIEAHLTKVLDNKINKTLIINKNEIWVLSPNNIYFSENGDTFTEKSQGIHKKVLKILSNGTTTITKENELLKDIAVDPYNHNNIITAGVNGIYVSTDHGNSWKFIPSNSATNGIKSVAIYSWEGKIHLFFGHPYQGIYHKTMDQKDWTIISQGLSRQSAFKDEVSTIFIQPSADPNSPPTILAAQNFDPIIFKVNINKKQCIPIYTIPKKKPVELLESLQQQSNNQLMFVNNQGVSSYSKENNKIKILSKIQIFIKQFSKQEETQINSISVLVNNKPLYNINELWMLQKKEHSKYQQLALHKEGVYVQTDVLNSSKRFPVLKKLLSDTGMNMIVVDMKDDFGNLRFHTQNKLLLTKGHISSPVNKASIEQLKKQGIYIVARIPIFKDTVLYKYNNNEYAIKDKSTQSAWVGLKKSKSGVLVPTKEYWVDPYNEQVWEYNITIAQELLKYGFDEIQFDYIRFPTDGVNLSNTIYPAQITGMDKESALISFLKYARANIDAPISIDIYGANGWMRTGARTGQDVELLSQYADIISPMYYPSHFGNSFLNYAPYEDRPYRIYLIGIYRNSYIARDNSIIRPYVQAFFLQGNPYDKEYYNANYIDKELLGIKDSLNFGYSFWNSSTKYSILYDTILNNKKK